MQDNGRGIELRDAFDITEIKAEKCRRSFWYFIKEFWSSADPSKPVFNWHMEYLADHLQYIAENNFVRKQRRMDTIINCPPGVSKSMIVSVMFNAWLWTRKPYLKVISASYSASVATELSVKTRNLVQSEKYRDMFPSVRLKYDENNKTNFKTTQSGFRYCTSTGSNILGIHADFIIGDDLENLTTINSDTNRNTSQKWVSDTLSTRKTDKTNSVTIYVQQRLGNRDLTSYLTSKRIRYKHIVLPCEVSDRVKPIELKEKYVDGLLDPNRLGRTVLAETKTELGTKNYNAQYEQDPDSDTESTIKKAWLTYEHQDTTHINIPRMYFLDTAYGGINSDYSAILECYVSENRLYITNVIRVQEDFPTLIKTIKKFIPSSPLTKVYIEGKASGKSIIQQLKSSTNYNIIELQVSDNKLTRLNAIAPTVEGMRVVLIKGSWNEDFVDEITKDNPKHDDMRDVFTYAVDQLLIKNANYGTYNLS